MTTIDKSKVLFLGKEVSLAHLRQLGIDDAEAIEMRGKIFNRNKLNTTKDKALPMVLMPHHQIRIWRTERDRDTKTGILTKIDKFQVEPNNGSRDILGIKFSYDYDKGFTTFTMTLNNARGKNKNRFASGDLVEFYFKLVSDKELRDAEKKGSLFIKNKEKIVDMPLCFTGVLDKYTTRQSPDGLVVEWNGRSGGFVVSERNIDATFPVDKNSKNDKSTQMSYEEVLWRIITNTTGIVMGEIDLGITEGKSQTGEQVEIEGALDLMADDVNKKNTPSFEKDFLKKVEEILLSYEYCYFDEKTGESDDTVKEGKGKNTKKPRWSCLLEYDLLTPKFYSQAEVAMKKGGVNAFGDYKIPLNGTGSAFANQAMDNGANEKIRFKTEWAMKLYLLQLERVSKNQGKILNINPIKTQVNVKNRGYRLAIIKKEWANKSPNAIKIELYKESFGKTPDESELIAWTEAFDKMNKGKQSNKKGFLSGLANVFFGDSSSGKKQKAKVDHAANKIARSFWKPGQPFKVGDYVLVPLVGKDNKNGPKKYSVDGGLKSDENLPGGANITAMNVYTVYTYNESPGAKIEINFEGDGKFVTVIVGNGQLVNVTTPGVPNRIDAIAQVIENSDMGVPLEVVITKEGTADLGMPLKEGTYELTNMSNPSSWVKAALEAATFEATGKVMASIKKILKKFFACIFYVDEFGIGHIRPRYKNMQKKEHGEDGALPIWGLYAGQPVYPRLFKTEMSDDLRATPNSVVMNGQVKGKGSVIVKVDHSVLIGLFGEQQRYTNSKQPVSTRLEAKLIAKNMLLDYVRNALTFACECDLIPELRPGHRLDIVDLTVGIAGRFLAEAVEWEYSKDTGTKMSLGLSFVSLASDDAFTMAAIASNKMNEGYSKRLAASINDRQSKFGFPMFRASNLEEGMKKDDLNKIKAEFADKVLPEFKLGTDGGVVQFLPRPGFEVVDKPRADDGDE